MLQNRCGGGILVQLRILHLEDNRADAELVEATLESEGVPFQIERVASREAFQIALQNNQYDIILSDFSLPQFDGLSALSLARKVTPDTPFLFLSGTIGEERAVDSLKNGAADYILKDRVQRLSAAILRAHNEASVKREKKALEEQLFRNHRVESIGALAGGIAHDLNNVLAPIMMVTELIRDHLKDADDLRMLDLARNSALRGADLVKQILQFARGRKSEGTVVKINELLDEMARLIRNTFPRLITFEANIPSNLFNVTGDATQIQQILLNLCVNARDAMPNGGTLSIYGQNRVLRNERVPGSDAPVSGSFVELSVRDTGTGIPPEILQKIFDPFFTTKPEGKGTGLGLATVQTIIRNHNGFLDLSSEVGKGTTFKILLPAAPTDTKAPAEEPKADEYLGQGEFILIADDERALLEITKELLEAYNYNVMIASNGKEALHIFQQNRDKIAVVMTDLHMPGMGGAELIAKIAADSPQAITVCMSGSTEGEIPKSELPLCKAFLRKPSSTQEMLRALNTLLADRRKA
jgi:signal transduction histidine kinase